MLKGQSSVQPTAIVLALVGQAVTSMTASSLSPSSRKMADGTVAQQGFNSIARLHCLSLILGMSDRSTAGSWLTFVLCRPQHVKHVSADLAAPPHTESPGHKISLSTLPLESLIICSSMQPSCLSPKAVNLLQLRDFSRLNNAWPEREQFLTPSFLTLHMLFSTTLTVLAKRLKYQELNSAARVTCLRAGLDKPQSS